MAIRARDTSRIHRRQCVACGYSGRFVDRPSQTHCPRCTCDFSERPPRSYAEMEGIMDGTMDGTMEGTMDGIHRLDPAARRRSLAYADDPPAREWRLVERWLLFLFGMLAIGVTVFALGVAALVTH